MTNETVKEVQYGLFGKHAGAMSTFYATCYICQIKDYSVVLGKSGQEVPFGICVWSTGNAPLEFVKGSKLPLTKDNR